MKTRKRNVAVAAACLLMSGTAAAWEEGVIVDFGGQSYEGWSGITQPAVPSHEARAGDCRPAADTAGCEGALPVRGATSAAVAAPCWPLGDTGSCAPVHPAGDAPAAVSSSDR